MNRIAWLALVHPSRRGALTDDRVFCMASEIVNTEMLLIEIVDEWIAVRLCRTLGYGARVSGESSVAGAGAHAAAVVLSPGGVAESGGARGRAAGCIGAARAAGARRDRGEDRGVRPRPGRAASED